MITHLAAAAASCNTGTWAQRWTCGWNQPVSPAVAHAGSGSGRSLVPALLILAAVILIARFVRKRRRDRAATPASAGARR